MLITTYIMPDRQAELRSGINGSGETFFQLQWIRNLGCYHIDSFKTEEEARRYIKSVVNCREVK